MPRRRDKQLNEAMRLRIKEIARDLMAEQGTAGLGLRAIARRLNMTAPAIYHYFPSMDDLLAALIVDAFTNYAEYVRTAREAAAHQGENLAGQLHAATHAYRQWALDNRVDFQLIYGNPIPGYHAPAELTAPAARLMEQNFMELLTTGLQSGEFQPPEEMRTIAPSVAVHYQSKYGLSGNTAIAFHIMNQLWSMAHGMVTLEVYNHMSTIVGNPADFYEQAMLIHCRQCGIQNPE